MKQVVAVGVLLAVAVLARADEKAKFDATKLVGEWTYTSGVRAGEKVPPDNLKGKVIVTKDTFTIPSGQADKPFVIKYKIDDSVTPAKVDFTITDGPVKEGKSQGIIAFEGDQLKVCYIEGTDKRPEKFESTKDNKAFSFTLKKAK